MLSQGTAVRYLRWRPWRPAVPSVEDVTILLSDRRVAAIPVHENAEPLARLPYAELLDTLVYDALESS